MERNGRKEIDLLDWLAEHSDCAYLSDLRGAVASDKLIALLRREDIPEYPLPQWLDAVRYITGEPCEVESIAAAKEALIEYLS